METELDRPDVDLELQTLLAQWSAATGSSGIPADAALNARQQDALLREVYAGLRQLAARSLRGERPEHTLRPTDLAHEAWLRLREVEGPFRDRAHLLAIAALMMRRILVDHARARLAAKRDGLRVTLDVELAAERPEAADLLSLDAALSALQVQDARKAQALQLHVFGGLSQPEIAELLGVSLGTVERDLRLARAFLKRELA
jgi:RNA polymerase sigma factor (TIGR02999 family)